MASADRPPRVWLLASAALVLVSIGVLAAVAVAVRRPPAAVLAPAAIPKSTEPQEVPQPGEEPVTPAPPGVIHLETDRRVEAAEWFARARVGEGRAVPAEDYAAAAAENRRSLRAQERLEQTEAGRALAGVGASTRPWRWLGPRDLGGRTRALVLDPTNPDVMFAAGITGGVWKSTDAGASWRPLTDTQSNIAVGALAMDPSDPGTLYAGTGEGYYAESEWYRGAGIMKSTDGGANWSFLPATQAPDFHYVADVVVSARDPNRVYAATVTGVWRSLDAGQSWSQVFRGTTVVGCLDLAIRADRVPDVLFASCGGTSRSQGVFRSVDGGATWESIIATINGKPAGVASMAIAPSDQDVVYASVAEMQDRKTGEERTLALVRSTEGGGPNTWTIQNVGDGSLGSPAWLAHCEFGGALGQGGYDNTIAVDPTDPDRVWVGGIDLYRSDDGGTTLRIASYWYLDYQLEGTDSSPYTHADQHLIVFDPAYDGVSNKKVYFAGDGGIFRTDDDRAPLPHPDCPRADRAGNLPVPNVSELNQVTYVALNGGYGITQFTGGDVSPDGRFLVGGTQDNGSYLAEPADLPGGWRFSLGGDGGQARVDTETGFMFMSNPGSQALDISRGPIGGPVTPATRGIRDAGAFYPPLVMDPNDPAVLWTAGTRVWRTTNSAQTWHAASPSLTSFGISAIAVASGDPNLVFAAFPGGLAKSTDAGGADPTWVNVTGSLPRAWFSSVAIDPRDHDTVYVTVAQFDAGHIWKSTDGGASWSSLDRDLPNVPANTVAINPKNPAMVYVGTDSGVFESLDGGASWRVANENLATTIVQELNFREGTSELYAFTFGRGAYTVDVGSSAPPVNDDFASATPVLGPDFTDRVGVRLATSAQDDPALACGVASQPRQTKSVWFVLSAPAAATYTLTTEGSNYDTVLGVFTGSRGSLQAVACDDDALEQGGASRLVFQTRPGTVYFIEVAQSADAREGLAGTLVLTVTAR